MFEKVKYPDGQISAKVKEFPPNITARINSYEDLMYVMSLADVYEFKGKKASLLIPCLFGQRSDRRFADNQSFDLKIISEIINMCNFTNVTIFDPHSDVSMALINNSIKMSPEGYIRAAVKLIKDRIGDKELMLVSPDAGAYKKVFELAEKLGLELAGALKHRDKDGKVDLTFMGNVKGKVCLIVDDLCDGGYTFELLGKALVEQEAAEVHLYVSHGYFSKGLNELSKVINHIYCTNSVKEIPSDTPVYGHHKLSDFLTQFKII